MPPKLWWTSDYFTDQTAMFEHLKGNLGGGFRYVLVSPRSLGMIQID